MADTPFPWFFMPDPSKPLTDAQANSVNLGQQFALMLAGKPEEMQKTAAGFNLQKAMGGVGGASAGQGTTNPQMAQAIKMLQGGGVGQAAPTASSVAGLSEEALKAVRDGEVDATMADLAAAGGDIPVGADAWAGSSKSAPISTGVFSDEEEAAPSEQASPLAPSSPSNEPSPCSTGKCNLTGYLGTLQFGKDKRYHLLRDSSRASV